MNLGAISNKNGGDCTPLLMGIIRAAVTPDPAKPPTDPGILDDTRLYPLASVACDRASAAGFDSLRHHHQPDEEPRRPRCCPTTPATRSSSRCRRSSSASADLAKVAKVESPRVYRVVATGVSGRVKKKITAIIDTKPCGREPADAQPGVGEGGGRSPVLARGIGTQTWPTPSAASTSARFRSSSPFSRWAFAPTRCAA